MMYRNNKDKEQDIKSEKAKNTLVEFVVKVNSLEFLNFARNSISKLCEKFNLFNILRSNVLHLVGNFRQSQSIWREW